MRTTTLVLSCLLCTSFAVGCGSKPAEPAGAKDNKEAKADAKKDVKADAKEEKKEAAGGGDIDLPKVGLKGTAPAGTNVSEMMGNDMVQGPGLVATVEAGDDKPKTGEEAQKEADMYSPENAKIEKLEDGYVLTFTNKGGMGTNYWVQARREIDGKAYWCTTTASQQEQSDNAVAFCKSLKK